LTISHSQFWNDCARTVVAVSWKIVLVLKKGVTTLINGVGSPARS